jgi:hypothetical protein
VFFAMMEQLSSDFTPNLDDSSIEDAANRMVHVIESCKQSKNIHELLETAKVTLPHNEIIKEFQGGIIAA